MAQIKIQYADGTSQSTEAFPGDSALQALIEGDIPFAYNCRSGMCQACRTTDQRSGEEILLCQMNVPEDGFDLEVDYAPNAVAIPSVTRRARLVACEMASDDVLRVKYKLEFPIEFLPGQYATLIVPSQSPKEGLKRRYFSCSGDTIDRQHVEFHIQNFEDGFVPQYLRERASLGDLSRIVGPHGTFVLRETETPKLFIAGGTGLAPFLSMLSVYTQRNTMAATHLLYGARNGSSLFGIDRLDRYQSDLPNLGITVCADDGEAPAMAAGSIVDRIETAIESIGAIDGNVEVYLCGSPGLVAAAKQEALRVNPKAAVYSEAFQH